MSEPGKVATSPTGDASHRGARAENREVAFGHQAGGDRHVAKVGEAPDGRVGRDEDGVVRHAVDVRRNSGK